MITGKISKIETMGLADGPGVRVVIFMQGCPLRCLYCHNPEMWNYDGGNVYKPEELLDIIKRYKNYFGSEGGVTFSGGDPLAQPEFLKECLKLCKQEGIHTCLDTSGVGNKKYFKDILEYVDLVILDIKALDNKSYNEITKGYIDKSLDFLETCQLLNKKLWLRSVVMPNINDNDEYIIELGSFIKTLKNIEKVELLPYHLMGITKYEKLGIDYILKDMNAMNKQRCIELQSKLNKIIEIK